VWPRSGRSARRVRRWCGRARSMNNRFGRGGGEPQSGSIVVPSLS
jgi:hypothetical protein